MANGDGSKPTRNGSFIARILIDDIYRESDYANAD